MQGSKIRLSPSEAALFSNAQIILTKNSIIQKTVAQLAAIQEQLVAEAGAINFASTPKISRGENYLGLPYVILDYPRISNENDLYFIRSLFWWGNFYSSTLHLSGRYKQSSLSKLVAAFTVLGAGNYFIGINPDPWQHHFEATNYQQIAGLKEEEYRHLLKQQAHIKIAARWPLSEWDAAATNLLESWKTLEGLVS